MMPDRELISRLMRIEGWISSEDCSLLFDLASEVRDGCIVEIGSYRGRSTMSLALGSLAGHFADVYAIDPQTKFTSAAETEFGAGMDRAAYYRNLVEFEVGEIVFTVHLTSKQASWGWDRKIGLLFVDGDHRMALEDVEWWESYLLGNGILALHDFETWECPRLAFERALASGYTEIDKSDGLVVLLKASA